MIRPTSTTLRGEDRKNKKGERRGRGRLPHLKKHTPLYGGRAGGGEREERGGGGGGERKKGGTWTLV